MRNLVLVASASLTLSLLPTPATAQEPHWVLEVPVDLKTINQEVDHAKVRCGIYIDGQVGVAPAEIGTAESAEIYPDGQGNFSGVMTLAATAAPGKNPGLATGYICRLLLFIDNQEYAFLCSREVGTASLALVRKPGTQCRETRSGDIFP